MTLSPFDPENFRIDPSRIIETEQGTKVVKTNKTAIETESGPQPAWKETAQKIIESPLASDRAKLFAASLLNRRSKILSIAQLQELERIKEQCDTWVPRAIWEPLAKETAKSDYLNEWEEAFFTTILDEQVKSISPKQMESLEASYKRIHDMNSKEAHSNRPVGFPQAWLKFFDSRTQIAALILTKY